MTRAQVDLLLADQPVVDYVSDKKGGKRGKSKATENPTKHNVSEYEVMTAQEHLEELRASGRGKLDLSQFDFGSQKPI